MANPKVSILIPAYNYGHYIGEAIESALAQTFGDFELIVVDNCSEDNTQEVVEGYAAKDARVRYIKNDSNIGMYRNYNKALLHASGTYIKYLNADDRFHPELLERFIEAFEANPTVSIVTSKRQYFGSRDEVEAMPYTGLQNGREMIVKTLQIWNWIGEPTTVMFKKENLNLGFFDPSLLTFADMDMWLRHLQIGDLYVIDSVLSYFRIHDEMGTIQLNSDKSKYFFGLLQMSEYVRFALQTKRFGFGLEDIEADDRKKINARINEQIEKMLRMYFNGKVTGRYVVRWLINLPMAWRYFTYLLKKPSELFK